MSERPHRREMLEWYAKQAGLSEEQMEQMDVRRREQAENTGERACTEGEEATADEADGDIEIPDEEPPQGWASWSKSMLGAAYTYAMSGSEPPPMTTPETATVDELLEIHADAINQILRRMSVDPLFQPERHDKLWLLRFYLSHKDVEKAANAMSRALATRKEKHLDEIGSIVRSAHPDDWPIAGMLEDLLPVVGLHRWWPDIRGCMLHIGKATDMDMHRLYREHDRFMTIALWGMEYTFQAMDALTRRTGRIQKYVRMLDVQGYPIRSLNLRFVRLLARQQGDLADLYPQLMGATYLVNVPSALKVRAPECAGSNPCLAW